MLTEAQKLKAKRFRERHPDKAREWCRDYYARNKARIIAQKKARRQVNPELRLINNLRNRTRKVLYGEIKSGSTIALLGCSSEELKQHLAKQFKEGMSWNNYGQWQMDHIIPLAAFNLSNSEEQKIAFHYTNLQPLWKIDNLEKKDKMV